MTLLPFKENAVILFLDEQDFDLDLGCYFMTDLLRG